VDHAAGFEPGPFISGPIEIAAGAVIAWRPLMQANSREQKEFVRDGVLVASRLAPPKAAATSAVPAGDEVGENGFCHVQEARVAGEIIGANPGVGPPAFVVVVEIRESAGRITVERIGEDAEILKVVVGGNVVFDSLDAIRRIPPASGVPEAAAIVPLLEN